MQKENLDSAYQHCIDIAKGHYENFPTASIFLNREQRRATAAIYAFARFADDLADEGELDDQARLTALGLYQQQLDALYHGQKQQDPVFIALADAIQRFTLPRQTLSNLLIAFRMDVVKKRYDNFSELREYCRHSADPIGELVLRLHGQYSEQNKALSDCICTALQLINFQQDLAQDYQQRHRLYIPLDEMQHYAVHEDMIMNHINSPSFETLVTHQLDRAQDMLTEGMELVNVLQGKLRFVMTLTICSGLKICEKLRNRQNCYVRPTLGKLDWFSIGLSALYFRTIMARVKLRRTT